MRITRMCGIAALVLAVFATPTSAAAAHPNAAHGAGHGTLKIKLKLTGLPLNKAERHATICPYSWAQKQQKPPVGKCAKLKSRKLILKGVKPGLIAVMGKGDEYGFCDSKAIRAKAGKTVKATWTWDGLPCTQSGST